MFRLFRGLSGLLLAGFCLGAAAQEFPARTIRLIVPTSVGTASDATARFIADQMAKRFDAGMVVDNRAGANGVLAVTQFLGAPADGYTLLLTASGLYANPALYKHLQYDPVRDFRLLAGVNQTLFVLVANPALPVDSVKKLVDYAKQHPNQLTYGSAGVGSSTQLGPELFASRAGITLRHIPYKGGAQAISDTAGGQVDLAMTAIPTAAALVAAGKLRALAVTGAQRSALMPTVPTMAQSGVVDAEIASKQAIAVRSGTPEAVAAKLTAMITAITATPEYAKFLAAQGLEPETVPAPIYANSGPAELERWAQIVKISGAALDERDNSR